MNNLCKALVGRRWRVEPWDKVVDIYIYIFIYRYVFKTTRSFRYQWFRVSTHQANATKHGKNQL